MREPSTTTLALHFPLSGLRSRMLSMLIFGLASGYELYRAAAAQSAMGKAAWVADQASRYDKFYRHPNLGPPIFGVFLVGLILLAYELLALGIQKLIIDPLVRAVRGPA